MLIVGENPVLSDANSSHVKKALEALDLLVVQDIFLTETAQLADVVLPAATFAEKDGTFTNTERRVQRVRKALDPPGEAKADWEIICALAERVSQEMNERASLNGWTQPPQRVDGHALWNYHTAAGIFDELAALTPSYAGMSYERLERGGLQWPCPTQYHPGTPYLHKGRFARGLGKFHAVEFAPPAELPDEEYPFYLSTGRIRFHYHTGTMSRRSRGLSHIAPEERIEMHPRDAKALGIQEGDVVQVVSRRGRISARVRITDRSAAGMVFCTFHFRESPINLLTNDALDPVGKIPEYKVCAVRIEKASQPA
jgi:predicted molibdopterin-dependent oxidoreductase YjgC